MISKFLTFDYAKISTANIGTWWCYLFQADNMDFTWESFRVWTMFILGCIISILTIFKIVKDLKKP